MRDPPFQGSYAMELPPQSMNRFDLQYWEGAREAALAVYTFVSTRQDVPEDVRGFATALLRETAEKKNRDFREALQLPR